MRDEETPTFSPRALIKIISVTRGKDSNTFTRWNQLLVESMGRIGRNLQDSQNGGGYMRDAGFEDVTEQLG